MISSVPETRSIADFKDKFKLHTDSGIPLLAIQTVPLHWPSGKQLGALPRYAAISQVTNSEQFSPFADKYNAAC